jgi:hypothetical protein
MLAAPGLSKVGLVKANLPQEALFKRSPAFSRQLARKGVNYTDSVRGIV